MKTNTITTLTVNPAIDKSTQFCGLISEQKLHCSSPHYDAGGGGINVSKAISRLGGQSLCIFAAGGVTGDRLEELIKKEGIATKIIHTKSHTRENFIALDTATNAQYRFGFSGESMSLEEQELIMRAVSESKSDFLVISGSLNTDLSDTFYQKIITSALANGTKTIVDTSGAALEKVVETGVFLLKPNVVELAKLVGVAKLETHQVKAAAKAIIAKKGAEIVVVSLGAAGAVLVTHDRYDFVAAPKVIKKSTVGAGDSMVGGMVWALAQNKSLYEVLRWGVACGSAATMNEGTHLFVPKDALLLFEEISKKGL